MAVPSFPESVVPGSAYWITLGDNTSPVVDGVSQATGRGLAHDNDVALAGAIGDVRDAGDTHEPVRLSPIQDDLFARHVSSRGAYRSPYCRSMVQPPHDASTAAFRRGTVPP